MKKIVSFFIGMWMVGISVIGTYQSTYAQSKKANEDEKAYIQVIKERADKIVETLNIADHTKSIKVRDMIAGQYFDLNEIQQKRDTKINSLKAKKADDTKIAGVKKSADQEIRKLHRTYLSKLSAQLTSEQVEKVKDGMTYNVVPLTFANYLLQTPYLTKAQQDKIMSFLIEARELAMDGGSSKEKHAWFGKYKGKITNYLTAEGYNMKKEGADWALRRKTDSDALEIVQSNRIMNILSITDTKQKEFVRNLIAHQYQQIQSIQNERDTKTEASNQLLKNNKEEADKTAALIWADYQKKFAEQRELFSSALSVHLDSAQLETVKNEMTDNSLQKEYAHFLALLPNLTDVQKKKVHEYLTEARDNAMNVLNTRGRNQWFAKFRGRANNYLAKEGYNLRKATEELERRASNNIN